MEFGKYLKKLRIANSLTQKELVTRINLQGEEFLGVDSVSISRWERGIIKARSNRAIKILRCITNDLFPYLTSLDIDEKQTNFLEMIARSRFDSLHSVLLSSNYEKKKKITTFEVLPLFNINDTSKVLYQLVNYLENIGEQWLINDKVDLFKNNIENKVLAKKIIGDDGSLQGHLFSLYFDSDFLKNYYTSPFNGFPIDKSTYYKKDKPMALYIVSRFAMSKDVYWIINTILVAYLASHANIHDVYFYVFDKLSIEFLEKLGAKKVAYNTPDENGEIKIGGQFFKFGTYQVDSADLLSRSESIALIKEMTSGNYRFTLKNNIEKTLFPQLTNKYEIVNGKSSCREKILPTL